MSKKQIPDCSIYAVIDRKACGARSTLEVTEECLRAKIEVIQLRNKTEDVKEFYSDALSIRRIIGKRALFIINDRADIAKLSGAHGLHLGQDDLPISAARRVIGRQKLIGKSCHSLRQAILAEKEGADYISVGPIFKTPTKPHYNPVGINLLKQVRLRVRIPIVAIGGLDINNVMLIKETGLKRIAVVRAVCKSKNILKTADELRKAAFG